MTMTMQAQELKPTRPVMRYHGGKWLLAPWIISHFPPHRIYVEPFGGAASVLLQKPRASVEVYNDLDGQVVNLFKVLRDPLKASALSELAILTPYSREEFLSAFAPAPDDVEDARRALVQSFMGRGIRHTETGHAKGFRASRIASAGSHGVGEGWLTVPERIASVAARFVGVEIENRDAAHVIRARDSRDTLFYVDPPYPHGTRYLDGQRAYRVEMADDEHRALAVELKRCAGMVVVSGYACELYDAELFAGWHRAERDAFADGAAKRTEVLWLNPRAYESLGAGPLFSLQRSA
jgi:DNA adenine methylase